jgi:serine/threonine protein kinase
MMTESETVNIDGVFKAAQKKLEKTYDFIRHLGGGEFSNVYLVKHKDTGQEHALKILDYHYLLQRLRKEDIQSAQIKFNEIKKRFITEAKLYKKIHHANIVKIHDTGVFADESKGIEIPYMIMSYIRGSSLSDLLRNEAPFEMSRTLEISRDVLAALEAMHKNNIIHRDIKPGNIMIQEETGEAVIIDFGIAKDIVGGTRLTTTGALLGSPMYMAPEQSINSSNVGPCTDIYSFGAVLFEMLTGETPFHGSNFMEIMTAHRECPVPNVRKKNPQLPVKTADILSKAMAKNPNDRYQRTKDLLNALEEALMEPMIPIAAEQKSGTWFKKYYIYLLSLAITAAALLFLLNPFNSSTKQEEKSITPPPPPKTKVTIKTGEATGPLLTDPILQMKAGFKGLKNFLNSNAGKKEKIEKCRTFLNKYQDLQPPGNSEVQSMTTETGKRMEQLETDLEADTQYLQLIDAVNKYIEKDQYDNAGNMLNKAKEIKDTDEIKQLSQIIAEKKRQYEEKNGESVYNTIKGKIDLAQFLEFKEKYPHSIHLNELIEKLKKADSHLPPEKYWNPSLNKNKKGYYEFAFGQEFNSHRMVFIPGKRIWIDKYEVSNRQFRGFLEKEKREVPPATDSKFFHQGDEYPAVVSYEDAEKYCNQYGFRLPSIDEWEYAAGKEEMYTYPWGNELPGGDKIWRANFDSLGEDGEEEKDTFAGTAPVKSFENFSSPFGVVNMAGNVWEWAQGRILKGGSFLSAGEDLMIKNSIAGRSNETQGFRCVKEEK